MSGRAVSGPPQIGLRRFRGDRDLDAMLDIIRAAYAADGVDRLETRDGLAASLTASTSFDPGRDILLAVPGPAHDTDARGPDAERPVAVSWVRHRQLADSTRVFSHFGSVEPSWRRRGIGAALLRSAQRRLLEVAATQPNDGPRCFASMTYGGEQGGRSLLAAAGYAVQEGLSMQDMVRPDLLAADPPPLPLGVEVRQVGPQHRRMVWEAMEAASADDLATSPGTEEDYRSWADLPFWDESLWQVAWDGDQIAGMVLNYVNQPENEYFGRRRGYTEYINVRRPWRRQGLARALILRSLHLLRERGLREAALDVHVHNPNGARQLYEQLGYVRVRVNDRHRKPMPAIPEQQT